MKATQVPILLAAVAALTLTACSNDAKAPEGQVVATVDGKDVTIHEVNAEIGGMGSQAQSAPRKLVEAVALSRVIERKMLAAEARTKKLDQSPQFVLAKTRADENLLVQALQAEVAGKVNQTPREGAQKFISDNSIMFAERRIMTLDQIQFLRTPKSAALPLKEAKTMQDVERLLLEQNIEYRRAPQQIEVREVVGEPINLSLVVDELRAVVQRVRQQGPQRVQGQGQPRGQPCAGGHRHTDTPAASTHTHDTRG